MDAAKGISMNAFFRDYTSQVSRLLAQMDWAPLDNLVTACQQLVQSGGQFFICGNGGSAANAIHLANDYLFGVDPQGLQALKVEALAANSAVLTCLGNDIGYAEIFAQQLRVKASAGDILLALSGSGNSPNILRAIEVARAKEMHTFAILGFSGGQAKQMVDVPIHFPIDDMQIAEDLQMITGHMLMRMLCK